MTQVNRKSAPLTARLLLAFSTVLLLAFPIHAQFIPIKGRLPTIGDICESISMTCNSALSLDECPDVCGIMIDTRFSRPMGSTVACEVGGSGRPILGYCSACRQTTMGRMLDFDSVCSLEYLEFFLSRTTPAFIAGLSGLSVEQCEDVSNDNEFAQRFMRETARIFCGSSLSSDPTVLPTPTVQLAPVLSPSPTSSASVEVTPSSSSRVSIRPTPSSSPSPNTSSSPSPSLSAIATKTASPSSSISSTATATASSSSSPAASSSLPPSPSASISVSPSSPALSSPSPSPSPSASSSPTASQSPTPSQARQPTFNSVACFQIIRTCFSDPAGSSAQECCIRYCECRGLQPVSCLRSCRAAFFPGF